MRHIKKPLNGGFLPKQGWVGGTHHFLDVKKMVAKMPDPVVWGRVCSISYPLRNSYNIWCQLL